VVRAGVVAAGSVALGSVVLGSALLGSVVLGSALLGGCRRCAEGRHSDLGALVSPEAGISLARETASEVDRARRADGAVESAAEVAEAAAAAQRLTGALLGDGIAPREVSSIADIRGFRLYRQGRYAQALAWFAAGARIDDSYEPCLFNAARAAAMSGDPAGARRYLAQLRRLDTPMARRHLARARTDPALAAPAPAAPAPAAPAGPAPEGGR
jgi:tetratricopeptide (TPR) repeat protein